MGCEEEARLMQILEKKTLALDAHSKSLEGRAKTIENFLENGHLEKAVRKARRLLDNHREICAVCNRGIAKRSDMSA
jgi:hypothetical protein